VARSSGVAAERIACRVPCGRETQFDDTFLQPPGGTSMSEFTVYGLEKLEDRVLLAVDVDLNGTTLVITSDGDDDTVFVYGYGAGDVAVYVDENSDGVIDDAFYYSGVRNIKITMGDGDDTAIAYGLDISGNLDVRLGDGDDQFLLTDYDGAYYNDIDGKVSIRGEDGDDIVAIAGADIDKTLTIDTGDGDDAVSIGNDAGGVYAYGFGFYSATGDLNVDGNVSIKLGDGDDYNNIEPYDYYAVNFGSNLTIDAGDGDDYVEFGDGGYDYVVTVEGKTNIKLGDGDDYLQFEDYSANGYATITFEDDVKLDGGRGNDDIVYGLVEVDFQGKVSVKNFEDIA
jgi:hypothetical protein